MKKAGVLLFVLFGLLFSTFCSMPVSAEAKSEPTREEGQGFLKSGHDMASHISEITGVAASPLLGLTVIGCLEYFNNRDHPERLPLICSPWIFLPGMLVLLLIAGKDTIGEIYGPLKKPLDMADNAQMCVTAVLAGITMVPGLSDVITQPMAGLVSSAIHLFSPTLAYASSTATAGLSGFVATLSIMVSSVATTVIFAMVWLASNAINVLMLIAPIPFVGGILKSARLGIIAALVIANAIHPLLGLALAVILIVIAYLVVSWSFRLTTLGITIIWDYAFRKWRFTDIKQEDKIAAFNSRKLDKVPARTYGSVVCDGDELVFEYRPWLILPVKKVCVPIGDADYRVARSLLYPQLIKIDDNDQRVIRLFHLRAKYRKQEVELAEKLMLSGQIIDVGVLKGLKAAWAWIQDQFSQEKQQIDGSLLA